ncbi:MAG: hypothetical protein ACUVSX_00295 [Aggregatilineales bacterium]
MPSNRLLAALLAAVLLAACQPAPEPPPLPTLAVLADTAAQPTPTQESTPAAEAAAVPSDTPQASPAPSDTPTALASATLIPSATFTPPPPTVPPPTATLDLPPTPTLPAVRVSTVTPPPAGAVSTPLAVADLVITERQFQDEIDRRVPSIDTIQRVRIDFTPQSINAELTALGGAAFVTGNVRLNIQIQGGFAVITIGDITVNALQPPETYVEIASREFFSLLIDALDTLLNSRMGSQFNLQDLMVTDDSILVSLLVPVE